MAGGMAVSRSPTGREGKAEGNLGKMGGGKYAVVLMWVCVCM